MFSLCSNFFDFALLRQGQFLENDGEKSEEIKSKKYFKQAHTKSPLFISLENWICETGWGNPQTPKATMALATLVSSQKQKLTIDKIFIKLDIGKAVFQRGE